jgi:hypothetical protein
MADKCQTREITWLVQKFFYAAQDWHDRLKTENFLTPQA